MKAFIDCRMLNMSGIGRYIRDFLASAIRLNDNNAFILAGDVKILQAYIDQHYGPYQQRLEILEYLSPIYSVSEQIRGSRITNAHRGVDLIHIPHYNAPRLLPPNSVVTIHDLIPFRVHHHHTGFKLKVGRAVLRNSLRKAGQIIAVSETTHRDILEEFSRDHLEDKITVIPNGISDQFQPLPVEEVRQFKQSHGLGRFILFVGNRAPHKNLNRLLKAWSRLETEITGIELVIAGKKMSTPDEVDLSIKEAKLQAVRTWEQVSDHELLRLYCGAEALVVPSLYEGFGLPPLEAMACGTPVVVSNRSAMPEVVGDSGIYVDPYDVDDIAHGILKVLRNSELHQQLSLKGRKRAAMFSWENTARQTLAVYQTAFEMRRPPR